ncbi:MAG: Hpt domain-containing protein [Clostridia bacterium]|nr:Hpt domain-containing protein [Clostridia bacterium]
MTVKDFYAEIGGDYGDAVKRLMNDSLIYRFIMKFPDDKSFDMLKTALQKKDLEAAFSAAHTLKGVTLNLAFNKLSAASLKLTDALRSQNRADYSFEDFNSMFSEVQKEYTVVCSALEKTAV